jgi:hypothetical protein
MSMPSPGPQIRPRPISSLCSLGPRPHLMTGYLRHILGEHFANRENIEEPALQDLLWRARGVGNILIESVTRWKPQELALRPAVIVKRNDWEAERLFPDDRYGSTPEGDPIFLNLMHGSHTLFCIAKAGEEAEILAGEVLNEIAGFGHLIRRMLNLIRFVPMGFGQIFELEEATENYAVPVNVAYAHQNSWTIHEHAPKMMGLILKASELAP